MFVNFRDIITSLMLEEFEEVYSRYNVCSTHRLYKESILPLLIFFLAQHIISLTVYPIYLVIIRLSNFSLFCDNSQMAKHSIRRNYDNSK